MPRDYDKPKKSWRDIDKQKDSSSHRSGDRPAMNPFAQARAGNASRVYKARLDSFFDGDGNAPSHVAEKFKALDSSPEGKARKQHIQAIKDARTSLEKTRAITEFLSKWELPPDYDVLVEVIACSDDEYVATGLDMIESLFQANRPPRRTSILEQRLRSIVSIGEEPKLQERARELLRQLRLFR